MIFCNKMRLKNCKLIFQAFLSYFLKITFSSNSDFRPDLKEVERDVKSILFKHVSAPQPSLRNPKNFPIKKFYQCQSLSRTFMTQFFRKKFKPVNRFLTAFSLITGGIFENWVFFSILWFFPYLKPCDYKTKSSRLFDDP